MNEKIIEEIIKNLKNPRFYVYLLVLLLVFLLLFPYIDANFFYYRRVNNRIDILTKMAEADLSKIEENPVLSKEYKNLLTEIEKQTDGSIGSIFMKDKDSHVQLLKFVTGGSLVWIIAIGIFIFKEKFDWKSTNILYCFWNHWVYCWSNIYGSSYCNHSYGKLYWLSIPFSHYDCFTRSGKYEAEKGR